MIDLKKTLRLRVSAVKKIQNKNSISHPKTILRLIA